MPDLPSNFRSVFLLGPETTEIRSLPLPQPGPGEVLLRVDVATTCGTDVKVFLRGGHPRMLQVPSPFGHEVAGTVVSVGAGVERRSIGERVVVLNSAPCGTCDYCMADRENLCRDLQYLNGAFAEFLLVPQRFQERSTHAIPSRLPSLQAALTEPLACVLHGIERSRLTGQSDILVLGAGPIGQLFVAALATENHRVVLADPNPERLILGLQMGAAATLHVQRSEERPQSVRREAADTRGFDLVIDTSGNLAAWELALEVVRPGGCVNLFGGCAPGTELALNTENVHYNELTIVGSYHHRPSVVERALELIASGSLPTELLISAEMPLDNTAEALHAMMQKKALKVAIRPQMKSS